ncbi:hypothetical protein DAT39_021514, partial [Clarias magur]
IIIMLGEAFLHVLNYTEDGPDHSALSRHNALPHTLSHTLPPAEAAAAAAATHLSSRSPRTPRPLR